jgi:serine O-acetyltransferase
MERMVGQGRCTQDVVMRNPWTIRLLIILKKIRCESGARMWAALLGVDIGRWPPGLILPHPYAIVLHDYAEIGEDCVIYQCVTVGNKNASVPTIGNGVVIYPGAVIVGNVTIGDGAVIGANSVVLQDVPPHRVAAGNPARLIG